MDVRGFIVGWTANSKFGIDRRQWNSSSSLESVKSEKEKNAEAIGIERLRLLRVSVIERFRSLRNYLFALNVSCPPTSTVERR